VTAEAAIFVCSICGEPAGGICVYCTKDACGNHRCDRCKRCSDCCECEIPLSAAEAPVVLEEEVVIPTDTAVQIEAPVEPPPQTENQLPQAEHQLESNLTPEQDPEPLPPHTENPIF
jgi:hypothetical protein